MPTSADCKANLPPEADGPCEPESIDSVAGSAQENGSLFLPKYTYDALPDLRLIWGYRTERYVTMPGTSACSVSFRTRKISPSPICSPRCSQVVSTTAGNGAGSASASGASTSLTPQPVGLLSAAVSVPPATLANTGGPSLWPWLLGVGAVTAPGRIRFFFPSRPAVQTWKTDLDPGA